MCVFLDVADDVMISRLECRDVSANGHNGLDVSINRDVFLRTTKRTWCCTSTTAVGSVMVSAGISIDVLKNGKKIRNNDNAFFTSISNDNGKVYF